jgi:PAT family beta-lactamase induction signal transducer AmpG
VPLLGRLGRRRGWMLLAQIVVAAGLVGMAVVGPNGGLTAIGAFAVVVAFASATQDIVVDAWRIEAADDADEMGLLSSAAQLGYRVAILVADAAIIAGAEHFGWPASYVAMAVLMGIGVAASLLAFEPARADAVMHGKAPLVDAARASSMPWSGRSWTSSPSTRRWASDAGWRSPAYRLPDFLMGRCTTPTTTTSACTKDDGGGGAGGDRDCRRPSSGIAVSGCARCASGSSPRSILGSVLQGLGTAAFALLTSTTTSPCSPRVMALDNFAQAFAGVALVAYMSSLTGLGYTATQYALLSSPTPPGQVS